MRMTLLSRLRHCYYLLAAAAFALLLPAMAFAKSGNGLLPIVFVHGSSGSAQQFETHAMRFTSNDYPQELLFAFEYDTSAGYDPAVLAQLDAFIDNVRAKTRAPAINAVAHSLGTIVMASYLNNVPGGNQKVARYVNIDGYAPAELPGGVPTIGIWGEWNSGGEYARLPDLTQIGPNPQDNYHFPDKSHTEVATSAEAFALMYEFFTGRAPATTDVVPEPPGQVTLKGRVVLFPENVGYAGATLEVWEVDPATGYRKRRAPIVSYAIDARGDFGPIKAHGDKTYEFAVVRPDGSVHHFYQQPYPRSNHFIRLNTGHPGQGTETYTQRGPNHALITITRQREFWGDQGHLSDQLSIDGTSVLTAGTSPRTSVSLAFFAYDHGLDGATDLTKGMLFPFNLISFLTAADVFIPATQPPTGTVRIALTARGDNKVDVVNVPNWASANHRMTVHFRDYVQARHSFTDYMRGKGKSGK